MKLKNDVNHSLNLVLQFTKVLEKLPYKISKTKHPSEYTIKTLDHPSFLRPWESPKLYSYGFSPQYYRKYLERKHTPRAARKKGKHKREKQKEGMIGFHCEYETGRTAVYMCVRLIPRPWTYDTIYTRWHHVHEMHQERNESKRVERVDAEKIGY